MQTIQNVSYKWNITDIFATEEKFTEAIQALENLSEEIAGLQHTLHTPEALLVYLQKNDIFQVLSQKVYAYASCFLNTNGENKHAYVLQSQVDALFEKVNVQLSFVEPEILKNSVSFFRSLLKDARFANYDKVIKDYIALKPHTLSQEQAQTLSHFAGTMVSEDVQSLLTDVEISYPSMWIRGKKTTITSGNISKLLLDKSRRVRMRANDLYKKSIKQFERTLGASYIASVKNDVASARIEHFKTTLQAKLFYSELPESVYTSLKQSVQENKQVLQNFFTLFQKKVKGSVLYAHDVYANTLSRWGKDEFTYEQAKALVKQALSILGPTYMSYVQQAFDASWIDVFPKKAKHSGGYCLSVRDVHPFILLNFNGKFDDVSTIAHEMGHAVHACLSEKAQPVAKDGHTLLTAETASITNELLLTLYCIDTTSNQEKKKFLIERILKEMFSTLYTQMMYSAFEESVHTMIENGQPVNYETLNQEFKKAYEDMFSPALTIEPFGEVKWAYIPHFYSAYYVCNYALGFLSALTIARKLRTQPDFVPLYIAFLSSGDSTPPLQMFEKLGISLQDAHCFDEAYEECKRLLKLLQEEGA